MTGNAKVALLMPRVPSDDAVGQSRIS